MTREIHRAVIRVDGRSVHVRFCGSGPAVVLLHQSPRSSAEIVPLIREVGRECTVIAPDTPGNGLSDPLPCREATMEDFALNLASLLDVLGLHRVTVYGFHTGASIACAFAAMFPDRTSRVLLNGLAAFDHDEQRELLDRYLPPFVPAWDGTHLAWLWARLREQTIFFPWYEKDRSRRMDFTVPAPAATTEAVVDFLRAGDAYRVPYGAAFAMDAAAAVARLRVPAEVFASPADPLFPHLERVRPHAAPQTRVETLEDPASVPARIAAAARGADEPGWPPAARPTGTAPVPGEMAAGFAAGGSGQLRYAVQTGGSGRPVVLLHGLGDDIDVHTGLLRGFAGLRTACLLELPGHGESAPPSDAAVEAMAADVAAAVIDIGMPDCDFVGTGLGGLVTAELVRKRDGRGLIVAPPLRDPELAAEERRRVEAMAQADAGGGQLLRLWHAARDRDLFFPWFLPERDRIIRGGSLALPAALTARLRAALRCREQAAALHGLLADYPLPERLAAAKGRLHVARLHWERDDFGPAAGLPASEAVLPAAEERWADAIAAVLP